MKNIAPALTSLLLALSSAPGAWAQASCSSDGAPRPAVVFERFINADCEACWRRKSCGRNVNFAAVHTNGRINIAECLIEVLQFAR